jgi:hypothetical protein
LFLRFTLPLPQALLLATGTPQEFGKHWFLCLAEVRALGNAFHRLPQRAFCPGQLR